MNNKDVFIKLDNFKFNFRVAAIIQYKEIVHDTELKHIIIKSKRPRLRSF